MSEEKLRACVELLRQHNEKARIITTPWDQLTGKQILEAMESDRSFADELLEELSKEPLHEHHHEHGHEHEHEDHHEHEHGHHHDHEETCSCGHDHHDHDADEVFTSWGIETAHRYTEEELREALEELDLGLCGTVLRAKGIVPSSEDGQWLHFDYVPGESEIRLGPASYTGQICVIGAKLEKEKLAGIFHI